MYNTCFFVYCNIIAFVWSVLCGDQKSLVGAAAPCPIAGYGPVMYKYVVLYNMHAVR